MPHRSGGGSHSGGHHSSHSSSSHYSSHRSSSHHSSHRMGGSGNSITRYSGKPFLNARRFRYYDKNGIERYVYCDRFPPRISFFKLIINLVLLLPFFLMVYIIINENIDIYTLPKPLEPVYEKTDVHISDELGIFEDENGMEDILQQFEDITGISPYIMTVYYSEWQGEYDDFRMYVYYTYLSKFTDEQHFLIAYSETETGKSWQWDLFYGDEAKLILTEEHMNRFGVDFFENFQNGENSVEKAFERAFENSLTYMMEYKYLSSAIVTTIFLLIIFSAILFVIVSEIKEYIMGKMDYQEVPMNGSINSTIPGATSTANGDFYNDEARFKGYEHYNDARYHDSIAYENGKK